MGDVPKELIETKGAVSAEVAIRLAEGFGGAMGSSAWRRNYARMLFPGGGSEEKTGGIGRIWRWRAFEPE